MTDPRQTTPSNHTPEEANLSRRGSGGPTAADPAREPDESGAQHTVAGCFIEGELDRGGRGVVCKAWQMGLNRPVALKMILHSAHARKDRRQHFVHEAGRSLYGKDHKRVT